MSNVTFWRDHKVFGQDQYVFDTNIWLMLLAPQFHANDPKAEERRDAYTEVYNRVLTRRSPICIDGYLLSEFANAFVNLSYKLVEPRYKGRKDFRQSSEFKHTATALMDAVDSILEDCDCIDSAFPRNNPRSLLENYASGTVDFTDLLIIELCKKNGCTLVTDDADFFAQDIPVVTANRKAKR
jgi:predicted nucleic acid-binding protein